VAALTRVRHPLRNAPARSINLKIQEGNPTISHLPNDGAFSPEKRVKRVFNLDNALVAGIINFTLETVGQC
jgi:hypothetical protein